MFAAPKTENPYFCKKKYLKKYPLWTVQVSHYEQCTSTLRAMYIQTTSKVLPTTREEDRKLNKINFETNFHKSCHFIFSLHQCSPLLALKMGKYGFISHSIQVSSVKALHVQLMVNTSKVWLFEVITREHISIIKSLSQQIDPHPLHNYVIR